MAIAEFTKILQKHIVSRVSKAAKASQALHGLKIEDMRDRLESFTKHDAIISDQGFDRLLQQFSGITSDDGKVLVDAETSGKLKYMTYSQLDKKSQQVVLGAITKFTGVNLQDFLSYITDEGTVRYQDSGMTRTSKIRTEDSADNTGAKITIIENIPQNKLIELLFNYMASTSGLKLTSEEKRFLENNIQAGHTAGVFNLKMINTFGLLTKKGTDGFAISGHSKRSINPEDQEKAVDFMNGVMNLLIEADRISSNMPDELSLFATSIKKLGSRSPTASTEFQMAWLNRESGSLVQGLGTRISYLIKASQDTSAYSKSKKQPETVKSLVTGIQSLAKELKKQYEANIKDDELRQTLLSNIDKYVLDYISTPSSPILVEDIVEGLISTLKGTKRNIKVYSTESGKIPIITNSNMKNLRNEIDKAKKAISTLKSKIQKVDKSKPSSSISASTRLRSLQGTFTSLPKLLALLNQDLQKQIKGNMGTGGQNKVLNYQTGRLSESAKVERMSQSREGMITALYSYMKYPYATFSEGGRQQLPHSRDPKLLISKSIREIAASVVGNRLRAVLI